MSTEKKKNYLYESNRQSIIVCEFICGTRRTLMFFFFFLKLEEL